MDHNSNEILEKILMELQKHSDILVKHTNILNEHTRELKLMRKEIDTLDKTVNKWIFSETDWKPN